VRSEFEANGHLAFARGHDADALARVTGTADAVRGIVISSCGKTMPFLCEERRWSPWRPMVTHKLRGGGMCAKILLFIVQTRLLQSYHFRSLFFPDSAYESATWLRNPLCRVLHTICPYLAYGYNLMIISLGLDLI
jgi:hypothetical protein